MKIKGKKTRQNHKYKLNKDIFKINIIYIFIILFTNIYLSNEKIPFFKKLNYDSQITMKIKGTGDQFVIYEWANIKPDQILVNGELQSEAEKKVYGLVEEKNNITLVWNNPLTDCYKMFFGLSNIISIDFSKFETSNVLSMAAMFRGCSSLTSLDLSNFKTSSVTNMAGMFQETNLISLDISNFDTSSVTDMSYMFYYCRSLISVNLENFNTSLVSFMNNMFQECNSLKYLNLKSFRTPVLTTMANMFQNCKSLISLNIDNFDTRKVTNMGVMLYGCSSLVSLNLKSFNTSSLSSGHDMLEEIGENPVFCIDQSKNQNIEISSHIKDFIIDCDNLCFTNEDNKFILETKKCIISCSNDEKYRFEYENICYENCDDGFHVTIDNIYLCQNNPEGYYLDNENNIYKHCYQSCKICNREGNENNHNCLECISNFNFINDTDKINNCYENCDDYYFFDELGKYECITENECLLKNHKLIKEKKKCINNCSNDDIYKYEYINICYIKCPNNTYVSSDNYFLCLENSEGYYLDNNTYKPCFPSCKTCTEKGDEINHNCLECINNYIFIKDNNCFKKCEFYYYFDEFDHYECTISNKCPEEQNKLVEEKNKCIRDCNNDNTYKFVYNNKCYKNCPINTYLSNDDSNICRKDPDGYYLENEIYKLCYWSCKKCYGEGNKDNHNCIECISNYSFINDIDKENNCYISCDYYYYFDSNGNYSCTINNECPSFQSKLIKPKNKCIDNCSKDDTYIYEENNVCVEFLSNDEIIIICPINLPYEKNKECIESCSSLEFLNKKCRINNKNNQTAKDNIIKSIKNDITNKSLKSLISNVIEGNKTDYIIEDNEIKHQITSTENQNNNKYNNISTILLGDCEKKLKYYYKIDEDESLIIYKIDIYEEGLLIPIIIYEVFHPLTLQKLDLRICENIKIGITIPVSIDEENLFKYNSSDDYYNDICYSYTTENGTDIVIKDRQNDYVDNNMSLCESNCEYTKYDSNTKKVLCECIPKNFLELISDIKNNKDKLLKNFINLKNSINLNIMKCYKKLFTKKGLIKNIGSYILLSIILIYILSVILFSLKGYKLIYKTVNDLLKIKEHNSKNEKESKNKIEKNKRKKVKRRKNKKSKELEKKRIKKNNKNFTKETYIKNGRNSVKQRIKMNHINVNNPTNKRKKIKNIYNVGESEYTSSKCNTKLELKFSENKIDVYKRQTLKNTFSNANINTNFNMKSNILNYNDYELNNLSYEEALKIDKRTYFQYYFSLLKQKHVLIFTFYTYNDYNSRIIKICLFFFSFALYYTVNALFFNYTTMHKIYEDQGAFNFIFQLPQILYSTIISSVINIIVKSLSLTQKNIIELKRTEQNIKLKVTKLLRCLIIKFILFFILSFMFLILFWYYLSCFCAVYQNTQGHLIKDTSISFLLSLIYPIFINLLPGIFRIPSLRSVKKNRKCLYNTSKIIQLI